MARLYAVFLAITVIAIVYVPTTAFMCCRDVKCTVARNCDGAEVCSASPIGCAVNTTALSATCNSDATCFCNTDKCNKRPEPPAKPSSSPPSLQSFALPIVTAGLAAIMLFVL